MTLGDRGGGTQEAKGGFLCGFFRGAVVAAPEQRCSANRANLAERVKAPLSQLGRAALPPPPCIPPLAQGRLSPLHKAGGAGRCPEPAPAMHPAPCRGASLEAAPSPRDPARQVRSGMGTGDGEDRNTRNGTGTGGAGCAQVMERDRNGRNGMGAGEGSGMRTGEQRGGHGSSGMGTGSAGWDPRCLAPGSDLACGGNAAFVESQLGRFAVAVLGTGIWENRELSGPGYRIAAPLTSVAAAIGMGLLFLDKRGGKKSQSVNESV